MKNFDSGVNQRLAACRQWCCRHVGQKRIDAVTTQILDSLLNARIIAVVRLDRYDQVVAIAEALLEGGIRALEFTLTGLGAAEASLPHVQR